MATSLRAMGPRMTPIPDVAGCDAGPVHPLLFCSLGIIGAASRYRAMLALYCAPAANIAAGQRQCATKYASSTICASSTGCNASAIVASYPRRAPLL
jgi:hypothetical protein